MDNFAAGLMNFDEMFPALRKNFDCSGERGLKISTHYCEFGTTKTKYLRSSYTPKGRSPESAEIQISEDKIEYRRQ